MCEGALLLQDHRDQEQGLDTVDANQTLGLLDDCREHTSLRNMLVIWRRRGTAWRTCSRALMRVMTVRTPAGPVHQCRDGALMTCTTMESPMGSSASGTTAGSLCGVHGLCDRWNGPAEGFGAWRGRKIGSGDGNRGGGGLGGDCPGEGAARVASRILMY
ncbi:hypothetical protein Vretifemale_4319 [Volvox reticuliferus]|uniref:Uncharacterized protein n=1 Tax=Volvox reticuliferus TaxID=1737510 RepID=A0A8J4C9P4_9CHLO|nr:hypothetical protein Vretifemale_4319 [Volvox reticuliferus]